MILIALIFSSEEAANTEGTNLWVANLSISVKEDDLSAAFGAYGTVHTTLHDATATNELKRTH